jgi:hypothetical protein
MDGHGERLRCVASLWVRAQCSTDAWRPHGAMFLRMISHVHEFEVLNLAETSEPEFQSTPWRIECFERPLTHKPIRTSKSQSGLVGRAIRDLYTSQLAPRLFLDGLRDTKIWTKVPKNCLVRRCLIERFHRSPTHKLSWVRWRCKRLLVRAKKYLGESLLAQELVQHG